MRNILEIKNSRVVVILAWEDVLVEIGRVNIGNGMLVGVPASEAHVQSTHESGLAINQAQLLMVGPVENNIVVHTIQSLQSVLGHLAKTCGVQRHILEGAGD